MPYIGKKYLNPKYHYYKILVIGPRHFCDAIYDTRNFLALKRDEFNEYIGKNATVNIEIGCNRDCASECLKDESIKNSYNRDDWRCPVYKKMGPCPLGSHSKSTRKLNCPFVNFEDDSKKCDQQRHLRCETIISIADYLSSSSKKNIVESKGRGKPYFEGITDFIHRKLNLNKEKLPSKNDTWEFICFMNLCQRYLPFYGIGNEPKHLSPLLEAHKDDLSFCEKVIEKLEPEIIIYTNPSVENVLKTIFERNGYEKYSVSGESDFGIYSKLTLGEEKWKEDVERMFESFPKNYYKARNLFTRLNHYVDEPKDALEEGYDGLGSLSGNANTLRGVVLKYALNYIIVKFGLENNLEKLQEEYPIFKWSCFHLHKYNMEDVEKDEKQRYDRLRRCIINETKKDALKD